MLIKAALCLSMFTVVRGEYARHNVKKDVRGKKHSNCYKGTLNNYVLNASVLVQTNKN